MRLKLGILIYLYGWKVIGQEGCKWPSCPIFFCDLAWINPTSVSSAYVTILCTLPQMVDHHQDRSCGSPLPKHPASLQWATILDWLSHHLLLSEAVTHCDVSLIQGYNVTLLKRLCVWRPTWATQSSRTEACAMPSLPSLSMAKNDGVNLNWFIVLLLFYLLNLLLIAAKSR